MGKACDQIQMLVDVVPAVDMMGNLSYFCDICFLRIAESVSGLVDWTPISS